MNKKISKISVIVLIAALAGWFGYKYFFANNDSDDPKEAKYYSSNSCWIYHEYVYRVDFDDENLISFFFIRNDDGTFSPSRSDSSGNQVTGNGFIIDSSGACVTTRKIYEPWILDDEGKYLLKELIDGWLELQEDLQERSYIITGQTVALFVILSDPKEFIEYSTFDRSAGQEQYGIIYPVVKTNLMGSKTAHQYKNQPNFNTPVSWFVLKTNFDENNTDLPFTKTTVDHITASISEERYLETISIKKGDEFFNEGSSLFNESGLWVGLLHYQDKKWQLISTASVNPIAPEYSLTQIPENWKYQQPSAKWVRVVKDSIENSVGNKETGNKAVDSPATRNEEPENRKGNDDDNEIIDVNTPFQKDDGWQILEEIGNVSLNPNQTASPETNNRSTHSFIFYGERGRIRLKVDSPKSGLEMTVTFFLMKENKETGLFLVKKLRRIGEKGYVGEYLGELHGTYYAAFDCDLLTEKVRLVFEKEEN